MGALDGSGQKDTGRGRHGQRRGLVLGQMIAVEARLVGIFQALQALLVQIRELKLITIDPVEDTKLHQRRVCPWCGLVISHLVTCYLISYSVIETEWTLHKVPLLHAYIKAKHTHSPKSGLPA